MPSFASRFAPPSLRSSLAALAAPAGFGLLAALIPACSSDVAPTPIVDASLDTSGDDAGLDSTIDSSPDSTVDAGTDSSADAGGDSIADAISDAGGDGDTGTGALLCPTTFKFTPPTGASNVRVAGEWQGFALASAPSLSPDGTGAFVGTVGLPPGLQAYKIVYDQGGSTNWVLDPTQGRRKYVTGTENSAVKVPDCRLPTFTVTSSATTRPGASLGTYAAKLAFHDGVEASGADVAGFTASLLHDGATTALGASQFTVTAAGDVTLALSTLADGKYRVVVQGKTKSGRVSEALRLVFWIESEAFAWNDALIYMAVTDRYRDGNAGNNPAATPLADPRGDWKGGDLQGITASITDGTLDKLGIRALWLTPFQTNPATAYVAGDGVHYVTGYHGYWPVKAREVEPRIGGGAALSALVTAAHQHGIRVLQDFVLNHVHNQHEYFTAHPEWFRDGCTCGTTGCDWTTHALDCKFASYLPDVNHTVPEVTAQFAADAVWWSDSYDLDGLRVDAVKHVEEAATRNLAAEVREAFEKSGTKYFLMGETAMGWKNCDDPCNDENYGTIAKYIGPYGLDGQFDFVNYHAVSYNTFAYGDKGMIHADYWFNHGLSKWPAGAIMTPYIGSHDTARFSTLADYAGGDRSIPGNQWSNTAVAPTTSEPYARTRTAFAWLLGLPGAPLMYYGDEYGQWGGSDPNNRLMWRNESALSADETATLAFVRKLGMARKSAAPMRRGGYVSLMNTSEDTLVWGRPTASSAGVVGITRLATAPTVTVNVATTVTLLPGTVLHDRLGGPDVTVAGSGQITFTIPARGAVYLAP
jgi:glycosidase